MKSIVICFLLCSIMGFSQENEVKTIHVFVALCDNVNQGIVPVPEKIGNGKDPFNNLYWGALYGVKTYFKKSKDWQLLTQTKNQDSVILERLLFKHKKTNTYLLADAYDGSAIQQTTIDFLEASAGRNGFDIDYNDKSLCFGGGAQLLAYVGHDGLMGFDVNGAFDPVDDKDRDTIILACYSKSFFTPYIKKTQANPILWSSHLMSPEAYTLHAAIEGWIYNESSSQIQHRAAQAYHKYQKCGINGAKRLLVTGF